jgi:hypothetical protein
VTTGTLSSPAESLVVSHRVVEADEVGHRVVEADESGSGELCDGDARNRVARDDYDSSVVSVPSFVVPVP